MNAIIKTIIFIPSMLVAGAIFIGILNGMAYLISLMGFANFEESLGGVLFALLISLSYYIFKLHE